MKTIKNEILIIIFLIVVQNGFSQGFLNLDFESANPTGFSPGSPNLPTSAALPGWTAYYSTSAATNQTAQVWYDSISLGGAFISLTDANNNVGLTPLQGLYSVYLEGASGIFGSNPTAASIGQTGTIPMTAQSLTFYLGDTFGSLQVTFNGQPLNYSVTGSTDNYNIYAADISAYAGQTGQLLFTAPLQTDAMLDNIQFSSSSIPEPSEIALGALGALVFGFRRWWNSSK